MYIHKIYIYIFPPRLEGKVLSFECWYLKMFYHSLCAFYKYMLATDRVFSLFWLVLFILVLISFSLRQNIWSEAWSFPFKHALYDIFRHCHSMLNFSKKKSWVKVKFPCIMIANLGTGTVFYMKWAVGLFLPRSLPCMTVSWVTDWKCGSKWAGSPMMQKSWCCYFHCFHCSGIYLGGVRMDMKQERCFSRRYLTVTPETKEPSLQFSGVRWRTPQVVILCIRGQGKADTGIYTSSLSHLSWLHKEELPESSLLLENIFPTMPGLLGPCRQT